MTGQLRRASHAVLRRAHSLVLMLLATTAYLSWKTLPPEGLVVSLTSHGKRIKLVHFTVLTIMKGSVLPSSIELWVDDAAVVAHPPFPLALLRRRGLKIKLSENFGPHTKYYPHMRSTRGGVVTSDDDVLYPKYWLQKLAQAAQLYPDAISCYRAYWPSSVGTQMAPYQTWELAHQRRELPLFATGVSGVYYPQSFTSFASDAGTAFRNVAPLADDVWLNALAVRSGTAVHLIGDKSIDFPEVLFTQGLALWKKNVIGLGNDAQIAASFDPAVVRALFGPQKTT